MSIIFSYEQKIIEEGKLPDPRIILKVETIRGFLAIKFLVDSGADVTTLPLNPYAELFNFKLEKEEKVKIKGVEGKGVNAYPFALKVRLGKKEFKLRCYFLESKTDPLLGRLDFWKLFSIDFDNRRLRTVIKPI